jgi:hypothetical protein
MMSKNYDIANIGESSNQLGLVSEIDYPDAYPRAQGVNIAYTQTGTTVMLPDVIVNQFQVVMFQREPGQGTN